MKQNTFVTLLSVAVFLSGCAQSIRLQPKDSRTSLSDRLRQGPNKYTVSVATSEGPVQNFEQRLVHRKTLPQAFVEPLRVSAGHQLSKYFSAQAELDQLGNAAGLRIVSILDRTARDTLGLQLGDLITAVGTSHVASVKDFARVFEYLHQNRQASITLVRNGKPHKVFYYLQ